MRLSQFIDAHMADILADWDSFAASKLPSAASMDALALRDHAQQIISAIGHQLRQAGCSVKGMPSASCAPPEQAAPQTGAQRHGEQRARDGFSMAQLVSEYRMLRSSVLQRWTKAYGKGAETPLLDDVMHFNEAVDQALAESVDFFGKEFTQKRVVREELDRAMAVNSARLEYASRLSHVGFWYCDLPFDVLEWDEQVKEHFFLEPTARVTIDDFYARIHPQDREPTRAAIAASINSREAYDIVYRTQHPDTGAVKWIRALGGTDYASDGSPAHFDGITVDVTAQKLDEQRVIASEARHRGVLSNMDAAFTLFDPDFNVIEVNDAACQLVGLERTEFLGANHWQLFPGTYDSALGHMYRQVLTDGQPRHLENRYVFGDGRAVWFEVRAFQVRPGVAVVFRDITRKREMIEALQNADRRKDEFLAMLAHELRNPLAPITTAGEILGRLAPNDGPMATATAVICRQAKHMTRLIDDLLDVARLTQGRIHLQTETVDIADVVAQACETFDKQLKDKQQSLTVSTDSPAALHVQGDKARLVQCVGNILANAIKYTDRLGHINLRMRGEGPLVIVEVSDNGMGIAPDLLPQIFELFVQNHQTLDRAQGGLGVGLAVVKRLVEMHGGRVQAFSAGEGHGARFELCLPRSAHSGDAAAPTAMASTPRRILVVDDNVDAAQSLLVLLELHGHTVMAVHDASEALACLGAFTPDLMLVDIGLPDIDGYALAQQIDASPQGRQVRKIAVTGYGQPEDRQRALQSRFAAHMVKPVDIDALVRTIAAVF